MKLSTNDAYLRNVSDGRIAVSLCLACGFQQAMPGESCFNCGAVNLEVKPHPGPGTLFSWVTNYHVFADEMASEVPYVIALVELEGGARVYGRLEPGETEISAGMAVAFDAGTTRKSGFPVFRPVSPIGI